jgi:hypothetical protein
MVDPASRDHQPSTKNHQLKMSLRGIFQKRPNVQYKRAYVAESDAARSHAELARDMALAGVDEGHPVWNAVLSLVDEHAESEGKAALAPNLTNEQRQYAAGAAATAEYLAQMLRDARLLASARLAKKD